MNRKIPIIALLLAFAAAPTFAAGTDRDLDNDGQWDYGRGGTDRDLDNDGQWDFGRGGTDRDLDKDGSWDSERDL
jgi:hypothetical protein